MARDDANYQEAQGRCRMSMLCRDCVRPLTYSLFMRIVELAVAICDSSHPRLTTHPQPVLSNGEHAHICAELQRKLQ